MRTTTHLCLAIAAVLVFALAACTTPKQPPLPVGALKLGVAPFTQPRTNSDMLAGYLPDKVAHVDQQVLSNLDTDLAQVLRATSQNTFLGSENAQRCIHNLSATNHPSALRKWSAVGRCMGVDLLVVPQLIDWRERDGGEVGVAKAAMVITDTFVLDVNNESLISRSRYDETQTALTDNLLDSQKFFKRGGKWVSARELAREGMEKALRDLGL